MKTLWGTWLKRSVAPRRATSVSGEDGAVGSCPGRRQCSGHGVCDDGYGMMPRSAARARKAGGGDCSGRLCPAGLSWFSYPTEDSLAHNTYASCSNMGCCDEETSPGQYESPFYGQTGAASADSMSPRMCSGMLCTYIPRLADCAITAVGLQGCAPCVWL